VLENWRLDVQRSSDAVTLNNSFSVEL
jgi:hypothetical protein